jgi:hypothetical protein
VTWNSLPLALAESNKYITGIPAGGLPKIRDDKVVFQASHPSLWSHEVIKKMQENMKNNKFRLVNRPPGRIVLFEVEEQGTTYDTTLNFSKDWLAIHIDDPTFAEQRKIALSRREEKRSRSLSSLNDRKESEEIRRPKIPPKKVASGDRMRRLGEKAQFLEDSQKGAANAKAVMGMLGFGPSIQHGNAASAFPANSKANQGSGASTPRSDPSVPSSHTKTPVTISEPPTPVLPVNHPRRAFKSKSRTSFSGGQNGSGNYSHITMSETADEVRTTMSPQPLTAKLESPVAFAFEPSNHWKAGLAKSGSWPPPAFQTSFWAGGDLDSLLENLIRFFGQ